MAVGFEELRIRFLHHTPNDEQASRMGEIRKGVLALATLIDQLCLDSREKSDALTCLDYVLAQSLGAIARREEA